jgi:hypothetical protein
LVLEVLLELLKKYILLDLLSDERNYLQMKLLFLFHLFDLLILYELEVGFDMLQVL